MSVNAGLRCILHTGLQGRFTVTLRKDLSPMVFSLGTPFAATNPLQCLELILSISHQKVNAYSLLNTVLHFAKEAVAFSVKIPRKVPVKVIPRVISVHMAAVEP